MAELVGTVDETAKTVPVEMLDYAYVSNCTDIKLVEQILAVLKSGKEGFYPDLIKFTENKYVEMLPPKEKKKYYALYRQTTSAEKDEAEKELLEWVDTAKKTDQMVLVKAVKREVPVRGQAKPIVSPALSPPVVSTADINVRVTSTDINVSKNYPFLAVSQVTKILNLRREFQVINHSDIQRCHLANQEKLKGNESFKMNENEKAVLHYSKSIAFDDSKVAVWANRAMAYIRLELFNYAEDDCSLALSLDSTYVKALFRRGLVRFKMGKYVECISDFGNAMLLDPDNVELAKLWKAAVDKYAEIPDVLDDNGFPKSLLVTVQQSQKSGIFPIASLENWECVGSGTVQCFTSKRFVRAPVYTDKTESVTIDEAAVQLSQRSVSAIKYKDLGNAHIHSPADAVLLYDLSLRCVSEFTPALNNRAQANLTLKNYHQVIVDSSIVLKEESRNLKGLYRRAAAYYAINNLERALVDVTTLLNFDKHNSLAIRLYADILLKKMTVSYEQHAFALVILESTTLLNLIEHQAELKNHRLRALLFRAESLLQSESTVQSAVNDLKLLQSMDEHFEGVEKLNALVKGKVTGVVASRDCSLVDVHSVMEGKKDMTPTAPYTSHPTSLISPSSKTLPPAPPATSTTPLKSNLSVTSFVSPVAGPTIPTHPPRTVYEFERIWRSLKSHPSMFAEFLSIFKDTTYSKVIKESTSEECLSSIFKAWKEHTPVLESRYKSMVNFEIDMKCIKSSIDELQTGGVSSDKVNALRILYKV